MELHLDGQHVLIVGGSSGIGWAIAKEFANEGCHVSILDRQPPSQEKLVQLSISAVDDANPTDRGHRYLRADVTDDQAMTVAFQLLSKLDLSLHHIVYAAGVGSGEFGFPFWNVAPESWNRVLEVNLMGLARTMKLARPLLTEQPDGSVTLLSSVAGLIGSQTDPPYSAAKAGVINFGQCMAKDLAPYGIRVNTVCPGMVDTPLMRDIWKAWQESHTNDAPSTFETWSQSKIDQVIPLGRWQEPDDVAAMVVFLASKRGRNITGQTINVDGGYVMR